MMNIELIEDCRLVFKQKANNIETAIKMSEEAKINNRAISISLR